MFVPLKPANNAAVIAVPIVITSFPANLKLLIGSKDYFREIRKLTKLPILIKKDKPKSDYRQDLVPVIKIVVNIQPSYPGAVSKTANREAEIMSSPTGLNKCKLFF